MLLSHQVHVYIHALYMCIVCMYIHVFNMYNIHVLYMASPVYLYMYVHVNVYASMYIHMYICACTWTLLLQVYTCMYI